MTIVSIISGGVIVWNALLSLVRFPGDVREWNASA
jgi:hypothetical protein